MRRFKVTITYEVDTSSKAVGIPLNQHLSDLVFDHVSGGDYPNLVAETDFRVEEVVHPANSDAPQA